MSIFVIVLAVTSLCRVPVFRQGDSVNAVGTVNAVYTFPCEPTAKSQVWFTPKRDDAEKTLKSGARVFKIDWPWRVSELHQQTAYHTKETVITIE